MSLEIGHIVTVFGRARVRRAIPDRFTRVILLIPKRSPTVLGSAEPVFGSTANHKNNSYRD
ncbi:hypothetical protein V0288_19950 [Pannus brasiliensis CCIBt3594]|uniref:Uncharacterized protein n=1 Tax=Pannus brasiliensis CCIBt3594 TaxID=1427578 RepID=A0AAW9QNP9_9CHRO